MNILDVCAECRGPAVHLLLYMLYIKHPNSNDYAPCFRCKR